MIILPTGIYQISRLKKTRDEGHPALGTASSVYIFVIYLRSSEIQIEPITRIYEREIDAVMRYSYNKTRML